MRGYRIWWKVNPQLIIAPALAALVEGLTPFVGIFLSARIINQIAGPRDPQVLTQLVAAALVSAALLTLLNAALTRWKNAAQASVWYQDKKIYADKLFSLDFRLMDDPHIHELRSAIWQNNNWSSWGLRRLLWNVDPIVKSLMTIAGAVALTVSLFTLSVPATGGALTVLNNPLFLLPVVAVMILVTVIAPLAANKASSYWTKCTEDVKMGNRYGMFFMWEMPSKPRALDVRMYRQDKVCKTMISRVNLFGRIEKFGRGAMGGFGALSGAISQVFTGIAYIFVCLKAWGGAFGVGSVTQYVASITALSGGVSDLIRYMGDYRANAAFLRTTFEFLDTPNEMYQGSLTVEKRSDKKYEIEFRDVSFQYPGSETYALRHVSLKFTIGQRLAVVGMNGSGKTTFIKLLCRLYDPSEGEILLNGINIRKYSYEEYMSIFSVVFQDFQLLSFGLGQNVAAQIRYDAKKAAGCLEAAGFGGRISEMPQGLETCLYKDFDEKGVDVSGGEAQKIALARALYKDAAFIILDEPTAALDPIAEFEVYSRMNEIVGGKTAVFISHRLSSCRFCQNIAVFHEGEVVQRGSHEELVADETGKYHELWHAQAQYYQA